LSLVEGIIPSHECRGFENMWLVIPGIVILLISSFLHSYCAIGVQCLLSLRPMIFDSSIGKLLQIGWIVLFVIGVVMLFFGNWIWGIVAIAVYWLLLPLLITPIVRKHMRPRK